MELTRRQYVLAASIATGALAGCWTLQSGGDPTDTDEPADPGTVGGGPTKTPTPDSGNELAYDWTDATWDFYWYSVYNMSTNIAMAGNGVPLPAEQSNGGVARRPAPIPTR